MNTSRKEHIEWVKQRSLEYVEKNDITSALSSFYSDMNKHPETQTHSGIRLATRLFGSGNLSTKEEMKNFIEGLQ